MVDTPFLTIGQYKAWIRAWLPARDTMTEIQKQEMYYRAVKLIILLPYDDVKQATEDVIFELGLEEQ